MAIILVFALSVLQGTYAQSMQCELCSAAGFTLAQSTDGNSCCFFTDIACVRYCTFCTEPDCFETSGSSQCLQPSYCGERNLTELGRTFHYFQAVNPRAYCQWDLDFGKDLDNPQVELNIDFTSNDVGSLFVTSAGTEAGKSSKYEIYQWEKKTSSQQIFNVSTFSIIYITSSEFPSFAGFNMSWVLIKNEKEDGESDSLLYLLVSLLALLLISFTVILVVFLRRCKRQRASIYSVHNGSNLDLFGSSEQVISDIESLMSSPRTHFSIDLVEVGDAVCSICFEEFKETTVQVRKLPCKHLFHAECIEQWMTAPERACPNCKSSILEDKN